MALVPIVGPPSQRQITTFDLEWIPPEDIKRPEKGEPWGGPRYSEALPLRVCGVYDEVRGFRHYPSIAAFLDGEMTKANKGRWFYAHFGGLADMAFVFDEIIKHVEEAGMVVYKVRACFSGSAAIIVRVSKGKMNWTFIDSAWLMRVALKKIGKDLHRTTCAILVSKEKEPKCDCGGFAKLEEEKRTTKADTKRYFREAPLEKLIPYNEQDNVILHEAVSQFQNTLLKIGGQLQMTIASTGLNLFRRKFLGEKIETSETYNVIIEGSYFASRVEVFNEIGNDFFIYDINSSFPYAMTFLCPGHLIGNRNTIPSGENSIYFADVDIEVPQMYLPPVPYRVGQRLFFPTGKWRSWLSRIDIDLLEKMGGRIHKVHDVIAYEPCSYLKDYAETIYEMRRTTKIPFEKVVYKYLLNCLYGKMAEGVIKSSIYIHPELIDRERMEKLMPGIWSEEKEAKVAHRHVAMSAWITAIARRTLYGHLHTAITQETEKYPRGCPIHYCDTDSVATPAILPSDDSQLGALKLEKKMNWARFAAPKVYQGEGFELQKDGTFKPVFLNKAKGFSLSDDKEAAVKELQEIIEGKEVYVQRMARLRELWKVRQDGTPVEVLVRKALTGKNITKRRHKKDGSTEPWTVKDLKRMADRRVDGMV